MFAKKLCSFFFSRQTGNDDDRTIEYTSMNERSRARGEKYASRLRVSSRTARIPNGTSRQLSPRRLDRERKSYRERTLATTELYRAMHAGHLRQHRASGKFGMMDSRTETSNIGNAFFFFFYGSGRSSAGRSVARTSRRELQRGRRRECGRDFTRMKRIVIR